MSTDHDHDHDHGHGHGHGSETALSRIEALSGEKVHHAGEHEGPFSVHVLGLGPSGAQLIRQLSGDEAVTANGFTALAVDIGPGTASGVAGGPVAAVELPIPSRETLSTGLNRYREFLKMEYPRYYWNPNYEPWLPSDLAIPSSGREMSRAMAKAVYGIEYYQDGEITGALTAFADGVLSSERTPLVVVAFSMADPVGSGIVVEIARHLSSIKLGRRPWVIGMGLLPTEPDASFFPVINELDCMIDTEKNNGVMAVWGDLYKNPFTGGFFAVPPGDGDPVPGLASFIAADGGTDLYETLKALNWLAVPGDQWHPAIRGEQSDRWVNVLTTRSLDDAGSLATGLGLTKGFGTEYAEARVFGTGKDATAAGTAVAAAISDVATTRVEPVVETKAGADFVSVVLPRASKLDLELFLPSRERYDGIDDWEEKLLLHAWLLDLGVMLCEPSIRFDGMGGECIWGCACWVVVPHAAIRGEVENLVAVPESTAPAV
ncbi:hypothetical protein [Pseudonocardia endophytica]|uniref:Tubulin-like protein n=1 Tax=Pseudonocardia endophytica TaxID=401976 RepID=A0A4R1HXL3_PSEEN|nr:hypothetical protein [Pseudonocardia endophytica]TCK24809.1 hypothetical protein EV378_0602 [Pseudonocardia endophytica]